MEPDGRERENFEVNDFRIRVAYLYSEVRQASILQPRDLCTPLSPPLHSSSRLFVLFQLPQGQKGETIENPKVALATQSAVRTLFISFLSYKERLLEGGACLFLLRGGWGEVYWILDVQ